MGTSQVVLVVKNPPANARDERDTGSAPGSGRSPGGGQGNPLQYSCLELPMDRVACQATGSIEFQSRTQLKPQHAHTQTTMISLIVLIVCQGIFRYWCPIHHVCFLNTDLITLTDFVEYNDNQFYKRPKKKSLPLHHFVKLVQLVPTNCKCLSLIFYF